MGVVNFILKSFMTISSNCLQSVFHLEISI